MMGDKSAPVGETYIIDRGHRESARLALQDWIFRIRLGFLLHPKIMKVLENKYGVRIADLGPGSCLWLNSMTMEHSNYHYTGLDISGENFPPKEDTLSNVTLNGSFDVFAPVPDHLAGKFASCTSEPSPLSFGRATQHPSFRLCSSS